MEEIVVGGKREEEGRRVEVKGRILLEDDGLVFTKRLIRENEEVVKENFQKII